jgi:site-specific DNA-methyltransferase (adenine-specific)
MAEPYYSSGGITIYHGDCRDVLPGLEADSAALVLADPPYGVGKADWDKYLPIDWMHEAARVAPSCGLMPGVWNLALAPERIARWQYRWMLSARLTNGMTNGAIGFGNWIPCVVYSSDASLVYRQDGDARDFAIGKHDKPDHPSPKPLDVMRWFVTRLSNEGDTVIDPFMGSGTTLRAAKDAGRKAIGIEINEAYCEIAAKRLAQEVLAL